MPKLKEHGAAPLPLVDAESTLMPTDGPAIEVILQDGAAQPELPTEAAGDSPAVEEADDERDVLNRYLEPTAFVAYLLERPGRSRIGLRRSFTNNLVARYLSNCTGQEWLVTETAALNAEAMTSVPLPDWLRVTIDTITSDKGLPEHVTPDEAIRATLSAMARDLAICLDEERPF